MAAIPTPGDGSIFELKARVFRRAQPASVRAALDSLISRFDHDEAGVGLATDCEVMERMSKCGGHSSWGLTMHWTHSGGIAVLATLAAGFFASAAQAEETTRPEIPRCAQSLGAITIVDGDRQGWTIYDLQSPQKLLKLYVQRSGCFTLVDRGAGFDAAQRERDLEKQGDLQRRSNVGGGQVRAADYVLVAEVVAADRDTGGSAVGGIIGGIVGGPIGGAIGGGLRTRDLEAQAILSVTDVRTSVTKAVEEGRAKKTDVSFALGAGGGGWGGWGGVVGGGYENTPIGQVVSLAFLEAYTRLVNNLGGLPADAKAAAPERSYQAMRATKMRKFPDPGATVVRSLEPGMRVFPLGEKDGPWWKVEDENGNQGWVKNTDLEPLR